MVQAILDGRKTITRRVVAFRQFGRSNTRGYDWTFRGTRRGRKSGPGCELWQDLKHADLLELCPYGQVGSRVCVRESYWQLASRKHPPYPKNTWHWWLPKGRDDIARVIRYEGQERPQVERAEWRKRPSIHMYRWASRITLEITEVRIERLQEISEADAQREGWDLSNLPPGVTYAGERYAKEWFRALWDGLNAGRGYGWEQNPWVWVIGVKMLEVSK